MDYIREELLRQSKLLSVLMTGRQQEQTEELQHREDRTTHGQPAADLWEERNRSARKNTGAVLHRRSRPESSGGLAAGIRMHGTRSDREAVRRGAETLMMEELAAPARVALYERTVLEETVGARELSRSIQRDARRYDGGFSIY